MNKSEQRINYITEWLSAKLQLSGCNGFVVGVSGGVDSALTSTLCAETGAPLFVLNLPIDQASDQYSRSNEHIDWLKGRYTNVESATVDLTSTFKAFNSDLGELPDVSELALVNAASRLRMAALYTSANTRNALVVGTGNKVEDYGIGFFTKYGDGGVDLSPIADLLKSDVYQLSEFLGVCSSILKAAPTDGLWGDNRSDEEQIGATYDEIEWALQYYDEIKDPTQKSPSSNLTDRQAEVLEIYTRRHEGNRHKLLSVPVCELPEDLKS